MVTIKKLNCGTTVIMEKSERVQSAALGIWVRAGASDEWDEVSGVSHFIEHMMFKGTKNRTAKQIAEAVGADLYEIRPAEPYTSADLNW